MKRIIHYIKKHKLKSTALFILLIFYYFCLPNPLFKDPTSTVIEAENGELLGAQIAQDGQWRFPEADSIPKKFSLCLQYFEDEYFYKHPGFNPVSMFKAISENIKAGKTVRGGSTLTQQLIRLSRKGKKRSYWEKTVELIQATRAELRYSKKDILQLYASHAPFGGNVVGLDMASWRYFGVQAHQLSWAESATLAVLPNAPSLIYPGKNQERLKKKRDALLKKLYDKEIIDSLTLGLAMAESLPAKPFPLPQIAPHFLQKVSKEYKGQRSRTTINFQLQQQLNAIVQRHYESLKQNEIRNAAVLVLDVHTREVLAYVGNTNTDKNHQKDVDIIQAARSTGSVLKPLLYAAMLDAGELLPNQLVADIPTQIAGYNPQNFTERYDGAVSAKRALSRSLNVPAVRLLRSYGLKRFRDQLDFFQIKGLNKTADHYGLPLILGGAEASLWDLSKTYASLASTLNHFNESSSEYFTKEFTAPVFMSGEKIDFGRKNQEKTIFDAGSIYLTFEAMKEVNRPEGNEAWEFFDSSKEVAWKTGTSFGNRDAWAIGLTSDYVVGVWAGNADGEGRPDLTGLNSAAPILFDTFDILPRSTWFTVPYDELTTVKTCKNSGFLATEYCPEQNTLVSKNGNRSQACKYHHLIHLDAKGQYRVNSSCEAVDQIQKTSWFVLPPLMEHYYKTHQVHYKSLPPYKAGCSYEETASMEFIEPKANARISLPKNFEGQREELLLKLAHTKPETTVFWYVNDTFIGQTRTFHEISVAVEDGKHRITVIDALGNESSRNIEVR